METGPHTAGYKLEGSGFRVSDVRFGGSDVGFRV